MKFGKKSKIIAAAMALMTFSTAAAVTGTVAWFTASNVVSVTGPTVQAEAEQGMVIANETHAADADWKQKVDASHDGKVTKDAAQVQATFIPTSTYDGTTWYHANSDDFDDYAIGAAGDGYTYSSFTGAAITETESGKGVYRVDLDSTAGENYKNIYLLNKFYVQSSLGTDLTGQDLRVKEITASAANSIALNKSLRVLFKVTNDKAGGTAKTLIYAPYQYAADVAHDGSNNGLINGDSVNGAITALYNASSRNTTDELLDNCTLKGYTAAGTNAAEISVFVYFEGEDANCKSSNLQATLESIQISFKLENKTHEA